MRTLLLACLVIPLAAARAQPAALTNSPAGADAVLSNKLTVTATNLSSYVPDDKHKLGAGDRVSFQILEDRDPPKGMAVTDSGELDIPYLGRFAAEGKTCKQVADELKPLLEKDYYHRATVILALDAVNRVAGRIYISGQVRAPGPLDLMFNENLTAGKAILRAGGFAEFANKKKVKVVRLGKAPGEAKQTFDLNMEEILEQGKSEKDIILQPDDFIIVPSRLINF
jgi:protein involved in polysaccharide export with SLBB domain